MLKRDFLTFDGLEDLTYTDKATAGDTALTVNNARKTFQVKKTFGEPVVKGYGIDSIGVTFPVDELSVTAKMGDTFVFDGNTYEVTSAELKTANTRWMITGDRAFVETDFAVSIGQERATLGVDVAGAVTESWSSVATLSAVEMQEDDVADMIDRLGVAGDKQAVTYFVAQAANILPMDRLTVSGRPYRITMIGDQGRAARLQRIRVELYA
jgi:hypothetical protein